MKTQRGFTLLELMITVGIVAILAGLAMAGYDYATLKTRRAAAQGCLAEMASALERRYTAQMSYTNVAGAVPVPACSADVSQFYTMSSALAASTFTVTATPTGKQVKDKCGTMSVNQLGRRLPTTQGCW